MADTSSVRPVCQQVYDKLKGTVTYDMISIALALVGITNLALIPCIGACGKGFRG